MAASDAGGGLKYWYNGKPVTRMAKGASDVGGLKYWHNGRTTVSLLPTGTTPAPGTRGSKSAWSLFFNN